MKYIQVIIILLYSSVVYSQGYVLKRTDGTTDLPDSAITVGKISGLKQWAASNIKTINGTPLFGAGDVSITAATLGLVIGTNVLAPNGSAAALTSFPTLNQNTSGTAAGLSTPLSFANGGSAGSAATSATSGTMTVSMTTRIITITPTNACTFNASGGTAGQIVTFIITTSGVSSFTLTWGTNFRKTGTLATGTTSARFFAVTFICVDGTIWQELSRTIVQS